MESSSLVKAHDHARAATMASRQTSSADTTVAINEHTLAAGEFAAAAKNTSSLEALRTLKLLEEHHRKLAEILKLPPEQTASSSSDGDGDEDGDRDDDGDLDEKQTETDIAAEARSDDAAASAADADTAAVTSSKAAAAAALPTLAQRYAPREMTSSIASNLASARGIRSNFRSHPLAPSFSNDQAPGNVEPHLRRDRGSKATMQNIIESQSSRPAWVPPLAKPEATPRRDRNAPATESKTEPQSPPHPPTTPPVPAAPRDDGGYARFYNTFGSLINKISAPLAFAGLPLIQEEPPTPAEPAEPPLNNMSPTRQHRVRISPGPGEPDLSKIYSRATLRALARDGHVPTDSFCIVPSTGHTMSYASILSYAEKEKRRLEASMHGDFGASGSGGCSHDDGEEEDDDDDFVDARENPAAAGARRRIGIGRSSSAAAAHTTSSTTTNRELHTMVDELSTENKSLKDMLDKLTKRLHTFEASAQSMALAESYRLLRPTSPLPSLAGAGGSGGGGGGAAGSSGINNSDNVKSKGSNRADEDLVRKNTDLEEQVTALVKQLERLERDNRRMHKVLGNYREKWESLKADARARRDPQPTAVEGAEDASSAAP